MQQPNYQTKTISWKKMFTRHARSVPNLIWFACGHSFFDKGRQTYESSCITFSNLRFEKKFLWILNSKYIANFRNFSVFY